MSSEGVTHTARGHGYKQRSKYPLTRGMTDDKPVTAHTEGPGVGMPTAPGAPAAAGPGTKGLNEKGAGEPYARHDTSMDGTVVGDNQNALGRKGSHKPDLISNTTAKLANPLGDLTDEEAMNNAAAFARDNDLDEDVFRKGGLLAKRPQGFEHMKILNEEDKERLRHEISHRYDQPWILYNLVSACSIAAAVQGMDESVISGAQLFYPKASHPSSTNISADKQQFNISYAVSGNMRDSWLEGLVNGAPYLCCAVAGCWLTDPLNKWLGR